MRLEELLEATKKYEWVSFDLFDTLIFRTVSGSNEIYDFTEKKYNEFNFVKLKNFRKKRVKAEDRARRKNQRKEVTINDIYKNIKCNQNDVLMKVEKDVEVLSCVPNNIMIDFVHKCQERGQRIIITTDMYMDKITINKIIGKICIKAERVFISSEIKKTKLEGNLFKHLIEQLDILPERICHIGDNPITDIKAAREKGIDAYSRLDVRDKICKDTRKESIESNHVYGLFYNKYLQEHQYSVEREIGYTIIGPFLYSFCKWIHDNETDGDGKLCFVAREGYLLKLVYELLYPNSQNILYVRINKNVVRLPGLAVIPTVEQFLSTIPYRQSYTTEELLELLSIDTQSAFLKNEELRINLKQNYKREELFSEEFRELFARILTGIDEVCEQQKELLIRYYNQISNRSSRIMLINNSANGSAQRIMESILKELTIEPKICGIQFVASKNCKKTMKNRYRAWFEELPISKYKQQMFCQYAVVFEHLLFESAGTGKTLCIEETGGVSVKCEKDNSIEVNFPIVSAIQQSVLDFVKDYKKYGLLELKNFSVNQLLDFELNPKKDMAIKIGSIVDKEFCGMTKLINLREAETCSYNEIKKLCSNYKKIMWGHGLLTALGRKDYLRRYDFEKRCKFYIKEMLKQDG